MSQLALALKTLPASWQEVLQNEFQKKYFLKLETFLEKEYQKFQIFPSIEDLFNAFRLTDFDKTKVVIIGQDPYHDDNQAMGLAFSVKENMSTPPSLKNIFKELKSDLGISAKSSNLMAWAKEGVLLLNTVLTVRAHEANSHKKQGWEDFTKAIVSLLSQRKEGLVFILWGGQAQKLSPLIDESKHTIISSVHPSPLSVYRGFWNSKPFSKTNSALRAYGKTAINWSI